MKKDGTKQLNTKGNEFVQDLDEWIETQTSHGYMPTDKRIAQTVDVWAFLAWNLGIRKTPGE